MASEQLHQAVTLLQLEDVYEIATRVSEEFQELASQFGGTRLATIVPIVLDALEQLERAITANQQLEIKVRRLILSNDALVREKDETSAELKAYNQVKEGLKEEQRERIRLTEEVARLRKKNESLNRKMDQMKIETESLQTSPLHTVAEESEFSVMDKSYSLPSSLNYATTPTATFSLNGDGDEVDDVMALSRVNKRLSLVESELDLTKYRLSTTQTSLQTVMSENGTLKSQVEQYKAELSLKTIETSRVIESCSHCQAGASENNEKSPRYFKEDLLCVLTERNELKEQIDSLRDELSMTQAELRKCHSHGHTFSRLKRHSRSKTPPARQRSSTRVREIFDSIKIEEYDIIGRT